jgi:hypothetical protein
MKKITLLIILMVLPTFLIGQNLITNGDFQSNTGAPDNWSGYNIQSLVDDLTNSNVGNVNNAEGSLFQEFAVTASTTYQVTFDYRWVSGTGNYTMTVRFRGRPSNTNFTLSNVTGGTLSGDSGGLDVNTTPDTWYKASFSVTIPTGESLARLLFFKGDGNRPFRLDNVTVRKLHTFDGSTDSDWATADNWDTNEIPVDDDIVIPSGQNVVMSSTTGATVGNLNVDGAGSLTINGGGSLVMPADAYVTGNITYNRTLEANKWHFVSTPIEGVTYDNTWMTNNDIATGSGTNRGISMYQNGVADPTKGQWTYVQTGGSGTFEMSTGYALRRASAGTVSFTGTYPIGAKPATVTSPTAVGTNKFNLVGNPYPTYLSVSDFYSVNATSKFTEETIWIWNQATGGYVQKTSGLDGTFQIAPGQAFFISSADAVDIFFFQYLGTNQSDTFLKTDRTQVNLQITSNNNTSSTELFYLAQGTNDFDNGYDASKFSGVASDFSLYTSQISNGSKNLGRQVLSNENVESLVVPLGIKATAGQEITFTAEPMNLPEGIKVFLEDRQNNTITRLDEANATYKVTLLEATDGTGRFFLHTKASGVLSTDAIALQNVSFYKTSNETLRVVGLTQGTANMKVFNVLGKQVLNTTFQSKGANDIALPKLATGMYIVQLQNDNGKINKKIILE